MTESSIFWVCWQKPIVYGHWNETSLTLGLILNFPLINSYIIENGVCYLTLTEKTFSKRAAFSFLEELSSEFQREFGSRVPTATRPYSFIEFGEWLKRGNMVLLKLKAKPPKSKKKQHMFLAQNLVKKKNVGFFCFYYFQLFFIIAICMLCFCVKTCKRWQVAHLHRHETFENLFHIAPLRRTLSGILQFKIGTMI